MKTETYAAISGLIVIATALTIWFFHGFHGVGLFMGGVSLLISLDLGKSVFVEGEIE